MSDAECGVRMMGIGGTGVVTVSQVLGMAALIDGLQVRGLDQTGLSQKGGPVVSDLRISRGALASASKAPAGSVDVYLGFDLLGASADSNLATATPARTVAVVSTSAVPTGRMVIDPGERFPELSGQLDRIDAVTRRELNLYLDAQGLSERLFGDHMMANTLALGAAFQRGLLPVSLGGARAGDPPERGRRREEPGRLRLGTRRGGLPGRRRERHRASPSRPAPELSETERELVDLAVDGDAGELRRLVETRVPELTAFQSAAYARRYAEAVRRVQVAEQERVPGRGELAEAVARNLFKLMAYKDEYEVARLHLDSFERAKLDRELGEGARIWFNLHPPLLRALGLKRKLKLGRWFVPAFRLLRAHAPPARHAARPVRPGAGAPRRAPARGRVRGAGVRGARGPHAGHPRDRRRALRAARHGARLRGHQAGERRALPRARAGAPGGAPRRCLSRRPGAASLRSAA